MSSWKTVSLSDHAESVDYGVTASASTSEVGPKFLRITDIQDGRVDWDTVPWCECDEREASASRLRTGDIVFARTGATTGKSFLLKDCPENSVFASYLIRVRVGSELNPRFLAHYFSTPQYWAQITSGTRGVAQPGVNATTLRALKLPLPPLAEQRRIAAVLDAAEALRAKRRAALAQLDTLTQAIFIDMFGDPIQNPKKWDRIPFGLMLMNIDSGQSPQCLDRPVIGDEWGVLKLGAVTWCEYDPDQNKALPPGIEPNPALEVKSGDLLFSRKNTNELVAACALVRQTPPRLLLPDLIFRFRLRSDARVVPRYLQQLIVYPSKRSDIQKLAGGSSGSMPNISKARLETVLMEVPPLQLQNDFTGRMMAIETLKDAHRSSLAQLDALFSSLQHRAFRGEL